MGEDGAVLVDSHAEDQRDDHRRKLTDKDGVEPHGQLDALLLARLLRQLARHVRTGTGGVIAAVVGVFLLGVVVLVGVAPGLADGFLLIGVLVDVHFIVVLGHSYTPSR